MYFERKAYKKLTEWKEHYSDKYAALLEGARRVGKSTIAENFAKMNINHIFSLIFQRQQTMFVSVLMI